MPSFQEVGFLGDLDEFRENVRAAHEASFRIADQVNAVAMRLMWELAGKADTQEKAYFVAAYARAAQHFQCLLLLTEKGAEADSRALLRALAETVFLAAGMFKAQNIVARLEADRELHRKMAAERIKALKLENDANANVATYDAVIAEVEAAYPKGQGLSGIKWQKLAEEVGLVPLYEAAYRFTSGDSAHATLAALARHMEADGEGFLEAYDFNPSADDLRSTIRPAIVAMLNLMELAMTNLGLPHYEADMRYLLLETQFFSEHL